MSCMLRTRTHKKTQYVGPFIEAVQDKRRNIWTSWDWGLQNECILDRDNQTDTPLLQR